MPVAWVEPRVDYCYDCLPGGPFTPPPCLRCGSPDYYSQGRCAQCHLGAPAQPGACRGCLAWGVYRRHNWMCWVCRWWQSHYPKVRASDVLQLPGYGGSIVSTLDVLDAAGLLIDDRPRPIETYFATKTALLPPVMREQLEVWLAVMIDGATSAPRQRARDPLTVKVHVMGITPVVSAWAEAGHQSLAEITTADVLAALPASGSQRVWAEIGLRSLFKTLKACKLVFANPMRGMKSTTAQASVPLPVDTQLIREELNSPNPAVALAVALVAFHALTAKQVAGLRLTDIADGRLRLAGRSIPLAQPVRDRLAHWLDHRASTWPHTQNPHLLITRRSAPRLVPVSRTFPWRISSVKPRALPEDRILAEVRATGGDARRLADLFGVSIDSASRYVDTLEHPDLTTPDAHVPGTSTPA